MFYEIRLIIKTKRRLPRKKSEPISTTAKEVVEERFRDAFPEIVVTESYIVNEFEDKI